MKSHAPNRRGSTTNRSDAYTNDGFRSFQVDYLWFDHYGGGRDNRAPPRKPSFFHRPCGEGYTDLRGHSRSWVQE